MRKTTQLLCEYLVESLALLVESYLIIPSDPDTFGKEDNTYAEFVACGHWELSMQYLNKDLADEGLMGACVCNSLEMIYAMIFQGAKDFDGALNYYSLSKYLQKNIIALLLDHGANPNCALSGAAILYNKEILQFLLNRGATNYGAILSSGALTGNISIIDFAIASGATNWNDAAFTAGIGNQLGIIVLARRMGGCLEDAISGACFAGHLNLIKKILPRSNVSLNKCLRYACEGDFEGTQATIEYLIAIGATYCSRCNLPAEYHYLNNPFYRR